MEDSFDPYLEWLGITEPHRPPNHYQLLGLELFEPDPERISNAGMMRMALVLSHDPGPWSEWAQRLYDELDLALFWLSDLKKKQAYDSILRHQESTFEQLLEGEAAETGPVTAYLHRGPDTGTATATHEATRRQAPQESLPSSKGQPQEDWHAPRDVKPVAVQYLPSGSVWLVGAAIVGMVLGLYLLFTMYSEFQSAPDPAEELAQKLQNPDKTVRLEAAKGLSKLGPRSALAIPELIRRMKSDPDDSVRVAAAEALYNAGPTLSSSLPEIKDHLAQEPHPTVKFFLQRIVDSADLASS